MGGVFMLVRRLIAVVSLWMLMLLATTTAFSQEDNDSEKDTPIRDNSFLVEEAYNQEQGVVQHIFNLVPAWEHGRGAERTLDFMFTQEWPIFSQRHQFSYAIPLRRIDGTPDQGVGSDAWGMGDILLNYRYQLLDGSNKAFPLAAAPRVSIIFPTGDPLKDLGNGKEGFQCNLPLSYEMEKWGLNFNAGLTKTDGVTAGQYPDVPFIVHTNNGYNLGGSAIYFLHPHFNLMLEAVAFWSKDLNYPEPDVPQCQVIVLPGFRWAPYTEGDTQWVIGCGLPIGVSEPAPDIGVFFYMSFEHRFLKKR
jgi:hypothetical protein